MLMQMLFSKEFTHQYCFNGELILKSHSAKYYIKIVFNIIYFSPLICILNKKRECEGI